MHHPEFQNPGFTKCALQVQKSLYASFITFVSCAFHVNPLSRKSLRYLTSEVSCNVCPQEVGSFRPLKSLFQVSGTIIIFME